MQGLHRLQKVGGLCRGYIDYRRWKGYAQCRGYIDCRRGGGGEENLKGQQALQGRLKVA